MATAQAIRVRNRQDLDAIGTSSLPEEQRVLNFEIEAQSQTEFSRFVQALAGFNHQFRNITEVVLQAQNVNWASLSARDFIEVIALLPHITSFSWISSSVHSPIPLPHLTNFFTRCPELEVLSLEGLHFLTAPLVRLYGGQITPQRASITLTHFCNSLRKHSCLKWYQCIQCQISEAGAEPADTNYNNRQDQENTTEPSLMETFVDETLKSLAFIRSLECIEIRAGPDNSSGKRALLGLCKDGFLTSDAIRRLRNSLQHQQQQQQIADRDEEVCPFEKFRLWIAEGYQQAEQRLLLDLCHDLASNTFLLDFRVRGGDWAIARFVTPLVIKSYQDLLESCQNSTLRHCELIGRQGDQVDFFCRLNGLGRGNLMQRLHSMTQREFVDNILLPFIHDLDIIYYWCRLHPLMLPPAQDVLPLPST